jgi:hypothetical protein
MSPLEDWIAIALYRLKGAKPTREQINALVASGGVTIFMFVTLLLASLVYLAMPHFTIESFIATVLVGLATGVATPLIFARSTKDPTKLAMFRKIAIVEGIAAMCVLPIAAGTTFDLIFLLLVTGSYAAVITVVCLTLTPFRQDDT